MVKPEVVEALLYGCVTWTPFESHYGKPGTILRIIGCCFEASESGASRRTTASPPTKTPSNELDVRYRSNRAHEEVVMGGGAAQYWRPQVTQEGYIRRLENTGQRGPGGKENE